MGGFALGVAYGICQEVRRDRYIANLDLTQPLIPSDQGGALIDVTISSVANHPNTLFGSSPRNISPVNNNQLEESSTSYSPTLN